MVESLQCRTIHQIEQADKSTMRSPCHSLLRLQLLRVFTVIAAALLTPFDALAQKFAQPQVFPTGNRPSAVYTADMNGDGIPDLVYLDQAFSTSQGLAHVLLGDGNGGFTAAGQIGTFGTAIALGDFAGNNSVQIASVFAIGPTAPPQVTVCAVSEIQISIALINSSGMPAGTVQGTFCAAGQKTPVFQNLTAGRLNAATGADLLMTDSANNLLYVVSTNSAGTIVSAPTVQTFALPDGPGPITVVDLNGDGHLDAVVNGQTGLAAQVFLGDGSGGLASNGRFAGLAGVHSMLIRDVNNDGRPDLIAEGTNGRMDIFPGNGDGTFQIVSAGGSGLLGGLTGNGGTLLTIANRKTDGAIYAVTGTPIGISVLLENATSIWNLNGIYNAGPGRLTAVADFNSDGSLDLAVDSPEGVAILYGNPDGSFQTSRAFAAGLPAMSGALGAFTSTGNIDAVVSTAATQAQMLTGNGDGTFVYAGSPGAPVPTTTQTGPAGLNGTVQAGDFNGDGKLDLAITADGPNALIHVPPNGLLLPRAGVAIQPGNGDGTFLAPVYPSLNPLSICSQRLEPLYGTSTVADFNRDGIADLANRDFNGERIYLGKTSQTVLVGQQYSTDANCNLHAHDLIVSGDLNNDGALDLIVQTDGHLVVQLNQGGGTFTFDPTQDLSIDGALTTPGQLTAPALSSTFNGPAIPTISGGLGFPAFIGSAVVADLDRDGDNDLIVTYANLSANRATPTASAPNYIYIWYGSGGGKFLTSAKHPVNPVRLTPSRNFYQAAVADLDRDGNPDLILSDGYILSVQLGKGDGTFGPETHSLAGQGLNTISVADVNHDGTLDLVIANGGAVWTNPVANLDQPPAAQSVNTGGITVLLNHAAAPLPVISGTVTAAPEPSTYGSAFAITATITPSATNNNPVTGSFAFAVDGVAIGSVVITGSSALIVAPSSLYSTLAPGVHTLIAAYSGDANWSPSTLNGTHTVALNPTSLSLLLCVDPPGTNFPCSNPIDTTPLIPLITMYYGQSLDGVAIESATNLTGTISFYSGTSRFCVLPANLVQGSQKCPPLSGYLPVGTTTVTAVYSGDSVNAASTSNAIVVTVLPDPTTAKVTSSLNPSTVGQPVTFTANVQGNFAVGAGPVIFLDGTTVLNTVSLDATGHATFTTSALALGTHPITAAYSGATAIQASTSGVLTQVVIAALAPETRGYALTVTPTPVTVGVGDTAILLVSVNVVPGFLQPVALTCTGLLPESTCTFLQPTIPAGGGSTTLQIKVSAPHTCGTTTPYIVGRANAGSSAGTMAALLAGGSLLAAIRRRRRGPWVVLTVLATSLCGLAMLSGCGNCTDLGTKPGSYTFTVAATAQGGPISEVETQVVPVSVAIP